MTSLPASRLAALPGYDSAPDVYETFSTPPTTSSAHIRPSRLSGGVPAHDETNTTSASPPTSSSEDGEDNNSDSEEGSSITSSTQNDEDEDNEEGESGVITRKRFPTKRARNKFVKSARGFDSKGADWRDRVDGRRRGYRVREDYGRGEEEGLEKRLARLRREVEECRALAEREKEKGAGEGGQEREGRKGKGRDEGGEIERLSSLLGEIDVPRRAPESEKGDSSIETQDADDAPSAVASQQQTLHRAAAFDTRLAALEKSLGLSSLESSSLPSSTSTTSTPLLPSLSLLEQQLNALSSATSLANLEAASARIHSLRQEAAQLSNAATTSSAQDPDHPNTTDTDPSSPTPLTPEEHTTLHTLHTLLPNLQSLSPTIPLLLTRLRTLRTLHASAGRAAAELDDVQKRQADMDVDLKAWREGLEKVEKAVREADEANGRNGRFVEGWVRELEGRMGALAR